MESIHMSAALITFNDDNLDFIRLLCTTGVDLNTPNKSGYTLFHHAVNTPEDNIGVVQELIRAGADVNFGNHLGFTPLHFAVIHRKQRVFSALIQAGAFVNAQTNFGTTALHMAVTNSRRIYFRIESIRSPNIGIINELLKHEDIDCNLVNSNGESPLMVAVVDQQTEATARLLRSKADPNISNKEFITPLHIAFAQSRSLIEITLLLSGANIYSKDKMGQTPLDILLHNGLDQRPNEWVMLIMKIIAFKYCITNDLKRKLEFIPRLYHFFNKCCQEVDQMRVDIISGKITVHDFVRNCFNENQFESVLLQIHKPVVDRLVRGIYCEYFIAILDLIPKSSLVVILEITVRSKKHTNVMKNDLASVLSITDIILLITNYLSKMDVFCLIVAFSEVKTCKSIQNREGNDLSFYSME